MTVLVVITHFIILHIISQISFCHQKPNQKPVSNKEIINALNNILEIRMGSGN